MSRYVYFDFSCLTTRAQSPPPKWLNLFPEIREDILRVFNRYRTVLDVELQQRACEYLAMASLPTDDLLQTVCDGESCLSFLLWTQLIFSLMRRNAALP